MGNGSASRFSSNSPERERAITLSGSSMVLGFEVGLEEKGLERKLR